MLFNNTKNLAARTIVQHKGKIVRGLKSIFHFDNKVTIKNLHNIPLIIDNLDFIIVDNKILINEFHGIKESILLKSN